LLQAHRAGGPRLSWLRHACDHGRRPVSDLEDSAGASDLRLVFKPQPGMADAGMQVRGAALTRRCFCLCTAGRRSCSTGGASAATAHRGGLEGRAGLERATRPPPLRAACRWGPKLESHTYKDRYRIYLSEQVRVVPGRNQRRGCTLCCEGRDSLAVQSLDWCKAGGGRTPPTRRAAAALACAAAAPAGRSGPDQPPGSRRHLRTPPSKPRIPDRCQSSQGAPQAASGGC
jgi:hypothetical protein